MPAYQTRKNAIVRLFCTLPTPRSIPVSSSRPARLRSRRAHSSSASIRRRRTRGAIMFCIAYAPNCQISNVGGARMLHMRRYRSKSSLNIIVPPHRILSTSLAARHTRETSFYQHRVNTHRTQHQDAHPGGSLRHLLAATAHRHAQLRARVRIEPSAGPRRARGYEREHPGGPGRGPLPTLLGAARRASPRRRRCRSPLAAPSSRRTSTM